MQFDPLVHTKEFLLSHPNVTLDLAEKSAEFAGSDLTNDFEILKLANSFGMTVAHLLALYQSQWVNSEAAKSFEILKLANIDGLTVAHELAQHQSEWIHSEAAKKPEILKLADNYGNTVAHRLAQYQSQWIHSDTAKSFEILKLANSAGWTVAHGLAEYQSEWIHSDAAKSFEILKLANIFSHTVAHCLAFLQSQWIHSEAAKNLEILKLADNNGKSVALLLARHNENWINHEPLLHKEVLTLENEGKLLAEEISEKYKSKGFDVPVMAMKLISQGAAYKHSKPIAIKSGEAIFKQCRTMIEDGFDPLVSFKQLQALYSTFSHNVTKIISTQEQKSLQKWQSFLVQSENMIRQHLTNNPALFDIEHTIDIFCEPGDDLLKKLTSGRVLSSNLESLNEISAELSSDQAAKAQNFY